MKSTIEAIDTITTEACKDLQDTTLSGEARVKRAIECCGLLADILVANREVDKVLDALADAFISIRDTALHADIYTAPRFKYLVVGCNQAFYVCKH